jgi:hypothetical protein
MRSFVLVVTAQLLFIAIAYAGLSSSETVPKNGDPAPGVSPAISTSVFPGIGVFFEFQYRPDRLTVDTMEREVQSIMRPTGLVFSWRDLTDPLQSQGTFADLIVVKFNGSCSGVLPPFSGVQDSAPVSLADTKVSDGQVLHFTEVHCDELRRYLSSNAAPLSESGRDLLYGRALGRIVSHEMWHILAGTEKHASGGVARACHSRQDLVQPVFVFDPKEEKILHDYAMRALLSREANPEP